jgi:hypothetical protein
MDDSVNLTVFLFHLPVQGGDPGALGHFRRYDDSDDDEADDEGKIQIHSPSRVLGQMGYASHIASFQKSPPPQETHSDVPTDELHDMQTNALQEQDLSGFDKAQDIQKGLGQFNSPERNIFRSSSRSGDDNQPTSPLSVPSASSGSFDAQDVLKTRKRIKRAARKQRAERKQPPVTMEV